MERALDVWERGCAAVLGQADGVHCAEGFAADVEARVEGEWQAFFHEGRLLADALDGFLHCFAHALGDGHGACAVAGVGVRDGVAAVAHEGGPLVLVVVGGAVVVAVSWVRLVEEEHALDDGQHDAHGGDQVGEQVGEGAKDAVLVEEGWVEFGGLGEEAAHGGANDAAEGPYEGLGGIGASWWGRSAWGSGIGRAGARTLVGRVGHDLGDHGLHDGDVAVEGAPDESGQDGDPVRLGHAEHDAAHGHASQADQGHGLPAVDVGDGAPAHGRHGLCDGVGRHEQARAEGGVLLGDAQVLDHLIRVGQDGVEGEGL